jgi:hypothetical protein
MMPEATMSPDVQVALHVLTLTEKGIQCATPAAPRVPFWLPRGSYVSWLHPPEPGAFVTAVIPSWLAAKHRQLVGDVAYKRVRDEQPIAKEYTMTDTPEDAGHGALFKNDKKEKPSHPDYRGDCTIKGRKFWMSAWIKEGQKGKYMSLAFRQAEDTDGKPSKPTRAALASAGDPF